MDPHLYLSILFSFLFHFSFFLFFAFSRQDSEKLNYLNWVYLRQFPPVRRVPWRSSGSLGNYGVSRYDSALYLVPRVCR
jgi:hypothetical protein